MSPDEALRTFVNALPAPAVLVREGHVLMNSPAQTLLGYTHEEIPTPEQWFATLYGEAEEDVHAIYTGQRYTGQARPVTLPVLRADGKRLWVQFSGHFAKDEEVWLLNDVTHHFETAASPDATEARWQSLAQSLPGWVTEVTLNGTVRWISRTPRHKKLDEIVGKRVTDLLDESQRADAHALLADMRHTGRSVTAQTQEHTAEGGVVWWEHTVAPLLQCGACSGFVVYTVDVTERHRQQEQILERERQLQQAHKMDALGRMAAGVAHDFNNLLTVIQGGLDLAAEELPDEHPALRELDDIQQAVNRATTLVRELLSVGRGRQLRTSRVNLNVVVESMEHLLHLQLGSVGLEVSLASDLPEVSADASQMEQVIANLVRNARDAMPEGGCVGLSTERLSLQTDLVTAQGTVPAGTYAVLHVNDTGVGMDEEAQCHLFEPFFTTKAEGKGTGLGFPVAYGIVQQSGGCIWFETELGAGTTFHVALPAAADTSDDT